MLGKFQHKIRLALGPVGTKMPDHLIEGIRAKMLEQNPGVSIDTFAGETITEVSFYYLVSEALEALQV